MDLLSRLTLESDLQRGLGYHEFIPFYQPIFHLPTRTLVGFEALVRWQYPSQGWILPDPFIHLMEASGLIVPVGLKSWSKLVPNCSGGTNWVTPNYL